MPQHWDQSFMKGQGFEDVIVHGWLTIAHMCRGVTDWMAPGTSLRNYSVRYHRPFYPGRLLCGGNVDSVAMDTATLSLWARNSGGELLASAQVTLACPR
jgi:hydroxyacyl-ACP dehydratase HTD2-like protein with hotdog domain